MPGYCEVALPVPLDRTFTYAVRTGEVPLRGARVIVPFRNEKLIGVVTGTDAQAPPEREVRFLEVVLDEEPLLSEPLLRLAEWIAEYYLAPLGEVLRAMLPLMAEVRRAVYYRITELGRDVLADAVDGDEGLLLPQVSESRPFDELGAGSGAAEEGQPRPSEAWTGHPRVSESAGEQVSGAVGFSLSHPFRKKREKDGATHEGELMLSHPFHKVREKDGATHEGELMLSHPFHKVREKGGARGVSAEEQNLDRRILARLASGEPVKVSTLRTATAATLPVLAGLVRRKWIARETLAAERDARRMERFALLAPGAAADGRALTQKQKAILSELSAQGGEMALAQLRRRELPSSTLQTLVRRGLVRIEERPAAFHLGGLPPAAAAFALNQAQAAALGRINAALGTFQALLLFGVTGSGKTAVYLAAMQEALERGFSSILLVPEIGLTPQTAGLLDQAFGPRVALLHSALTPDERSEQWRRIRRGEAPIVVGTRSAIFAPAPNLGLILVDEEHDQSYKQEETPRYNARDVAVMRAKLAGAVVVLGSATPSLESWQNAERGKYARIELPERVMNRPLPEVELVDMRQEFRETGQEQIFSRSLMEQTRAALERGEQALILLNRRGYSFAVICRACGEKLECQNCAIALTHHKSSLGPRSADEELARAGQRLECHYCGFARAVPARCPKCESEHLYYLGAGSQQGEERLAEIFPGARIGRMDRDTVRGRRDLEQMLARLHAGEINLLVGTQMIAKGHDVHGVTLVGVVGCDHALSLPDFRAAERVFQLIAQVSGRAGRGELPGRVVVQTYYPDHYAILAAVGHDYGAFAERELKYRRWMHYPPFGALANVLVQSAKLEEAAGWAAILGKSLVQNQTAPEGVRVLGPCTAPIARIKGVYRFHLIVKSASRGALNAALRRMLAHAEEAGVPRRNLVVDVDALRLM
jgi:primosomal protein N' (replication factor Y) (superfamily II helicase)